MKNTKFFKTNVFLGLMVISNLAVHTNAVNSTPAVIPQQRQLRQDEASAPKTEHSYSRFCLDILIPDIVQHQNEIVVSPVSELSVIKQPPIEQ